jgi:hypothetical protein
MYFDKRFIFCYLLALFFLISSCASTRIVRPLAKGEKEIGLSVGGPIIGYSNALLPIPMTSIYYAKGITDSLSVFSGLNGTSLLFGTAQVDVGACYQIMKNDGLKPGISLSHVANLMLDKWDWDFRLYPQVDAHVYWNYKQEKGLLYVGMSNWFELKSKTTYQIKQDKHWVPIAQLGTRYQREKLEWTIESRYIAPNYPNKYSVVEWKGIGSKGAFGLYFGVNKKF